MNRRPMCLTRLAGVIVILVPLAAAFAEPLKATLSRPANPHGKFRGECADCHSASAWKPAKVGPKFDHAKFGFALEGAHAAADCRSCHASLDFTQERQICVSCHQDVHRGEFGTECAQCHTARSFIDRGAMVRRHQTSRFPLTGSHAALQCENCHRPAAAGHLQFVGKQADCSGCHMAAFQAAKSPDHAGGNFPLDCMTCHTTASWRGARFNHNRSGFPLTGAHRAVACASCHAGGVYQGTSSACASCHRGDYDRTTGPAHATSGFSTQCATCHNTTRWAGAVFDHNLTAFPLTGAHRTTACTGCHGDGVYAGKSTACASCHQGDYDRTTDPPHVASGFPTACATCHGTTQWAGAVFDHNLTAFPLTGAHRTAACSSCHGDGVYAGKSTACASCHQGDYDRTTDPSHVAAGFSTACATCHGTTGWQGAIFAAHDAQFFPIYSGVHLGKWAKCATCHTNASDFSQFTCFSCHPHDDKAGTDGKHSAVSGYSYTSQACYSCHPRGRR